jgi:hypothetical protein
MTQIIMNVIPIDNAILICYSLQHYIEKSLLKYCLSLFIRKQLKREKHIVVMVG